MKIFDKRANIYYLDSAGKETSTDLSEMPQKCGDCPFKSNKEVYSHYDDLEGFDVYSNEIVCDVNGMKIESYRSEGSLRYDYGYEERTLGTKPDNCPLYQKSSGKLILISGPSGVGKGPIIDTLFCYAVANDMSIKKHVLYTNRQKRHGEKDGETYHFTTDKATLEMKERESGGSFKTFPVRGEQVQGIDIKALKNDLSNNAAVILEIFYKQMPAVVKICEENGISVRSIFIKPLSEDDYKVAGCSEHVESDLEMVTKAVMFNKLTNRATESREKVLDRISSAYAEIKEAKNYNYQIVNHYGEDNRTLWNQLKEFAGVPGGLEAAKNHDLLSGIANTFSEIVSIIE